MRVVTLLMERANLTEEEATRVFLVEVARWNYRIHVIAHRDALPPSEQKIFDNAVRLQMSTDVARFLWDNHFKNDAHPDVVKYLELVVG